MPNAKPAPNSSSNYAYWEKYLDYIIGPLNSAPPNQDSDRITGFNNPNRSALPNAKSSHVGAFCNKLGYITYLQFMMDHGRDLSPIDGIYVPLSTRSPHCPWHDESTAGGNFSFPPRCQPLHATRRALIAAMQIVKRKNLPLSNNAQKDWVSIISFDRLNNGGPIVKQTLTADYDQAMEACTRLQATGDKGAATATDAGLIFARKHIRSTDEGGRGRMTTNKVVVLLTNDAPNLYISDPDDVAAYINSSDSRDFYPSGDIRRNAPLAVAARMNEDHWTVFPVGVGLGTDYDFMDRMSRIGGRANQGGRSPRGSGNPAEYEQRMADIFREIITTPQVRLVQ